MIRYLKDGEKKICRELWEEAFSEDSREFGDYYFEEKVKDNRVLVLMGEEGDEKPGENGQKQDRVDAMIHLNPYVLMVRGRCWRVDYLVGVATRGSKRHRGYMRRLLLRMMKDLRREGMPFCFLMPADEAIYRPFGFTYIYRQERFVRGEGWERLEREPGGEDLQAAEVEAEQIKPAWEVTERKAAGKMCLVPMIPREASPEYEERVTAGAGWMNRWLENHYQVYARRDREYLKRLVDELASEEGTLDILYCKDKIVAMEGWWGRKEREQRLLYGEEPYVKRIDGAEKPAIMARIISPETFVSVIHLKENRGGEEVCTIRLYIEDPLIEENEGLWLWHLNRVTSWLERQDEGGRSGQSEADNSRKFPCLALTIDQLTAWLFGYRTPQAAKGYEDRIETLQGVFLDEVV